jgi:hypothetical protein
MSAPRKMKVATKLGLSHGVLVALIAVIGIVCALRFKTINARIAQILGPPMLSNSWASPSAPPTIPSRSSTS